MHISITRELQNGDFEALYFGEPYNFNVSSQGQNPLSVYTLTMSTPIFVDSKAVKKDFKIGDTIKVDGVFCNFHKLSTPKLTLCLTKIYQ